MSKKKNKKKQELNDLKNSIAINFVDDESSKIVSETDAEGKVHYYLEHKFFSFGSKTGIVININK